MSLKEEKIADTTFSRAAISETAISAAAQVFAHMFLVCKTFCASFCAIAFAVAIFFFLLNAIIFAAPEIIDSAHPTRIERVPHDVVYLVDETTQKRVLLLPGNWSPEVIDEFHQFLSRGQQSQETLYTIHQILANGVVEENFLKLRLQFQVMTTSHGSLRVPLGLSEGVILIDQATPPFLSHVGNGHAELGVMADGSYVAVIENQKTNGANAAKNDEQLADISIHEIALTLWFPITITSDSESRCDLTFPNAISSQIELTVPIANAVMTSPLAPICSETKTELPNQTTFTIQSLKNLSKIAWRSRSQETQIPSIAVENGYCKVTLSPDETQSIKYEVTLPISTRTTPIERCSVRFPEGTIFDPATHPNQVFAEDLAANPTANPSGESSKQKDVSSYTLHPTEEKDLVEIIFSPPVKKGSVSVVSLNATRSFSAKNSESGAENLSGFEVIGADKQSGTMAVHIPENYHASFPITGGIRLAVAQNGTPRGRAETTKFDYFAFPFSAQAKLQKINNRIYVKPEHTIKVSRNGAALTSRFTFQISGAKQESLQIELGKWSLIELSPSPLVDDTTITKDNQSGLLIIPLRSAIDGVVEFEIKAELLWTELNANQYSLIDFPIPMPRGDWVEYAPTPVAIYAANNVKLLPIYLDTSQENISDEQSPSITDLLVPLRRFPFRKENEKEQRKQESLIYQISGANPRFVANAQHIPRQVSIVSETVIRPSEKGVSTTQVTQTIRYNVDFDSLKSISIWIPKSLDKSDALSVKLLEKGKEVAPLTLKSSSDDETHTHNWIDYVKRSIDITTLGSFSLSLTYSLEAIEAIPGLSVQKIIPLILPADIDSDISKTVENSNLGNPAAQRGGDITGGEVSNPTRRGYMTRLTQSVIVEVSRGIGVTLYGEARQAWIAREISPYSVYQQQRFTFVADKPQMSLPLQLALTDPNALGVTEIKRIWLQTWLKDNLRTDFLALSVVTNHPKISFTPPPGMTGERCHVMVNGVSVNVTFARTGEIEIPLGDHLATEKVFVDIRYQIIEQPNFFTTLTLPRFPQNTLIRSAYWNLILPHQRHLINVPQDWTPEYRWQWNGFFWQRLPLIDMSDVDFPAEMVRDYHVSSQMNQYLFSSFHHSQEATMMTMGRSFLVLAASSLTLAIGLMLIYLPQLRYAGSLLFLGLAGTSIAFVQPTLALLAMQASFLGCFLVLISLYFHRLFIISRPKIMSAMSDTSPTRFTPRPEIHDETSEPNAPRELPVAPTAAHSPDISPLSPTSSL